MWYKGEGRPADNHNGFATLPSGDKYCEYILQHFLLRHCHRQARKVYSGSRQPHSFLKICFSPLDSTFISKSSNMKTTTLTTTSLLTTLTLAAPTRTLQSRAATSQCAQYAETTSGDYTFNNDLWGEANGSGSQCYTIDSDSPLAWTSTWSWSGGQNDVKSYANAVYNGYTATQLSGISSIPSKWEWSYTGDSLVADVSYDLFTSSSAGGSNEYEIMVWLAALGGAGEWFSTLMWQSFVS
jgi:hypothetical protein